MGNLLPRQRLQAIARRWEAHMDATAVILPLTETALPGGVTDLTYPDPSEPGLVTTSCRLRPGQLPEEGQAADQDRGKRWWQVQCPVASRIVPTDRLVVTGMDANGTSYTRTLEVVGPQGPMTWEALRLVRAFEIVPSTGG